MEKIPHYTVKHVGINTPDNESAQALADQLCSLFNVERTKEGDTNIFTGTIFEVMKNCRRGKNGHIALQTEDVELAMADLAKKGITFQEDTIRRNEEGKIIFIYLQQDIGGFSFHLTT